MLRFTIFVGCLFLLSASSAQKFGGNPGSVKWQQVNTDTVRVIFPQGLESQARRVATVVHTLQRNYSHSIGDRIRKINIVLQNQGLVSNAYVGLAPYRSEFYLTPPQGPFELGAVSWPDYLAVHEFRHVQQYSNFNKGLAKVASVLLGEQGQALANAASIPDWFFEGDAVYNETRLTAQGRGALPLFMSSYKALFNAGKQYDYLVLRNGSFRKYVPNHYNLGYLLVAYGRKQYGEDLWRKVTDDAARFRPLFYPFQGAVKKYTGVPFKNFVADAMKYYQQQWQPGGGDKTDWLTPIEKNNVVNYKYPYLADDGSLIVLKNSYRAVPAFYRIAPDGAEEKIAVKDIGIDDYFSYRNGRIVYTTYQPDARWGNREFNSITMLDVVTREETTIAARTKYFAPDISSDGSKIIAVESDPLHGSKVVVMNPAGALTDSLHTNGVVFSNPKFAAGDQHYFVAARNEAGEMALLKYTLAGKQEKVILPFANRILGFLNVQGDSLLFSMSSQGRDEVWAFVDGEQRNGLYRLATYSTGIYQAAIKRDGNLAGSAFTADGYRLGSFQPLWQKATGTGDLKDLYVGDLFREPEHHVLENLKTMPYAVTKYAKGRGLLNIHSYEPAYEQPEYTFRVYGENVLNTFRSEIAYTYNENEGSHKAGFNGIYGGTYLQPLFGINQTWQRSAVRNRDTILNWNELVAYAGLQLPLNLSGGKQYRFLTLSSTWNTEQVKWTGIAQKLFQNRSFNYLDARIAYAGQVQKAVQQIYPHWAQAAAVQYKTILNRYTAHQFLATGSLYLPGLGNNHSLVLTGALHTRDTLLQYLFSNNFPFSRGYTAVDFPVMWRFGANYHIPIAYPDWGVGGIVYFQRLRANLFFDHTTGKSLRTGTLYPFQTVGTELFFDTKWWNQQPVTFGIRYSHLLNNEFRGNTQPNVWEVILPVNLFD